MLEKIKKNYLNESQKIQKREMIFLKQDNLSLNYFLKSILNKQTFWLYDYVFLINYLRGTKILSGNFRGYKNKI